MPTLGKDCTISCGGFSAGVRSVVWSSSAKEIELHPFGGREVQRWVAGHDSSVEVEFIEDPGAWGFLESGSTVSISGSNGSGTFVVVSVQCSEPLDDVVTYRIQARKAHT